MRGDAMLFGGMMRALIQKSRGEFANINFFSAYIGFVEKGYDIEFFEPEEIESKPLELGCVVVGGIPIVVRALEKLGVSPPGLVSIPPSISPYARREIWVGCIGDVRRVVDEGGTVFVKPLPQDRKLFGGKRISSYRDLAITASLPADYSVMLSQPVNMLSEYRAFVVRGAVVGCRHYKGDFRLFPDFKVVESAIRDFKEAPSGYAIDFAVLESGETVLVEVNEGFSLGCYGLLPVAYASLLEARWADFKLSV
jgi:hypothetical protein